MGECPRTGSLLHSNTLAVSDSLSLYLDTTACDLPHEAGCFVPHCRLGDGGENRRDSLVKERGKQGGRVVNLRSSARVRQEDQMGLPGGDIIHVHKSHVSASRPFPSAVRRRVVPSWAKPIAETALRQ